MSLALQTIKIHIMKKLILPSLIITCFLALNSFVETSHSFEVHNQKNNFFTNGAPAGKTGAPGESSCTGCHAGSANDGSTTSNLAFSGTNNEYQAGNTYNMTLSINNGSNKNGFQVVALENAGNSNAGMLSVTDPTNTSSTTGSGKTYINQTANGTTQTTWAFDWTAPAANTGDVTLYYSYNVTNSDGGTAGDQIYLGQLTLQEEATSTSIQTPRAELNQSFAVSHNNSSDQIQLEFNNAFHSSLAFVKVFNINGQCIQVEQFSINAGENQLSTQPLVKAKGIYMVSLFLDNNVVTKKIAIN